MSTDQRLTALDVYLSAGGADSDSVIERLTKALDEARAEGAAAERERIITLARQRAETMADGSFDYLEIAAGALEDFADLLEGTP